MNRDGIGQVLKPAGMVLLVATVIIWVIGHLCGVTPSILGGVSIWLRTPVSEISVTSLLIGVFFICYITRR